MAWQLRHAGDGIRVEGRSPLERCRLETDAPARAARILLGSGPSISSPTRLNRTSPH